LRVVAAAAWGIDDEDEAAWLASALDDPIVCERLDGGVAPQRASHPERATTEPQAQNRAVYEEVAEPLADGGDDSEPDLFDFSATTATSADAAAPAHHVPLVRALLLQASDEESAPAARPQPSTMHRPLTPPLEVGPRAASAAAALSLAHGNVDDLEFD